MFPEPITSHSPARPRQRGMALVGAIFLLAALGALAAGIAALVSFESSGSALDVQSARALRAAQAGIDWAAYRVLQGSDTCASAWPSPTLAQGSLPGSLAPFAVTVSCTHTSHGSGNVEMYKIIATASSGSNASGDHVERQLLVWLTPSP